MWSHVLIVTTYLNHSSNLRSDNAKFCTHPAMTTIIYVFFPDSLLNPNSIVGRGSDYRHSATLGNRDYGDCHSGYAIGNTQHQYGKSREPAYTKQFFVITVRNRSALSRN